MGFGIVEGILGSFVGGILGLILWGSLWEDKKRENNGLPPMDMSVVKSCLGLFINAGGLVGIASVLILDTQIIEEREREKMYDLLMEQQAEYQAHLKITRFFAVLSCFFLFLFLISLLKYKKNHPYMAEAQLYKFCAAQKITSAGTTAEIEKIKLIAKQKDLTVPTDSAALARFFERGRTVVLGEDKIKAEMELARKKAAEKEERRRKEAFISYHGREKRLAMLRERIDSNTRDYHAADKEARSYTSLYQKESDWGLAGGIASGIAGPAAGVAAAVDTMQKNAEVRAYNQAIGPAVAMLSMSSYSTMGNSKQEIERCQQQISETELLLVDETVNGNEIFQQQITVHTIEPSVTETGSVRIKAEVSASHAQIYSGVIAVVDGYLKAKILQQGKVVGEAALQIGLDGLDDKTTLYGICTELNDPKAQYSVEIVCGRLWLIEGTTAQKAKKEIRGQVEKTPQGNTPSQVKGADSAKKTTEKGGADKSLDFASALSFRSKISSASSSGIKLQTAYKDEKPSEMRRHPSHCKHCDKNRICGHQQAKYYLKQCKSSKNCRYYEDKRK